MDALRHVGRGEAARILGPGLLGSDFAARRDLYTEEERLNKFLALPPAGQQSLQAFADGVNRAMAEMAAQGNLPAEFVALNHAPEPWTVLDTIAVADFLLDRFGTGGGGEVDNAKLLAQLQRTLGPQQGEVAFDDLVWGVRNDSYSTIPVEDGVFTQPFPQPKALADLAPAQRDALLAAEDAQPFGIPQNLPPLNAHTSALPDFNPQHIKWGSNAILIAPKLSRTGQAMVGGGPQTGYFNPEILYEVGLHGGGVDVVGAGVMGAPGVVLGRTPTFAWTVTSGESDETDMVALPAAGARSYTWDGQTRDLQCRQEMHVAVNPPALGAQAPQVWQQEVCVSHVGVIDAWTVDAQGNPTYFFAAHKAHRFRELSGALQWLSLDSAKDLNDFRAAFDGFPFTFNFNYAGPEGACYHHVGVMPIRPLALDMRFPTPAGEAWNWTGELTGAQLPRFCNPEQGYFVNWNNLPERGWPSGDGRELWGGVHRVQLLDAMVKDRLTQRGFTTLTLADVQGIAHDAATRDPFARAIVPLLIPHAPSAAQQALKAWQAADYAWRDADADGLYDDAGYALYVKVRQDLQSRVFADEQGAFLRIWDPNPETAGDPHAGDQGTNDNKDAALLDALGDRTGFDWCDNVATAAKETCSDVIADSFAEVGSVPAMPVWHSRFSPIGAGPAYEMNMTNRATYFHFHVGSDPTQSVSAIAPGESGHLSLLDFVDLEVNGGQGPPHMHDQLPLYEGFQFKPVPVSEEQARALASSTTILVVGPAEPFDAVPLLPVGLPVAPNLPVGIG
jgi:penicillin amidase